MEWKSNLKRTQSLGSVPSSCDQPTLTGPGLRDRTKSVSQLVARYQTTVEVSSSIRETPMTNGEVKQTQVLKEITPSPLESQNTLEILMLRNEERERSRAKASLVRSKSMGSLQSSAGSIGALRALFESRAATQNNVKSTFRAESLPYPHTAADIMQVTNRDVEEVKSPAEKPRTQIPADAPVNDAKDHVTRKVVNQTRMERRKTIGGIDFERIAASHADEKRRSIADFRDGSFFQTKEILSVSVKAMSALYLSKVAPQESTHSLLKPAQDQSSESGKRVKQTKMAEDPQHVDDFSPLLSTRHQSGSEDISGAHVRQSVPSQLSKEKLHQQRQKCELRRLLKHTHPELKMLDDVVDEELAEVLGSETGVTTGECGYEGEVLSRCLIFENCALNEKVSSYTPKTHMAAAAAERGGASKKSSAFEEHEERLCRGSTEGTVENDEALGSSPDLNTEREAEIRIDMQATRMMFESGSVNTSRLNPDNIVQGKVSISGDEPGAVQKRKQGFENCKKDNQHSENKTNSCTNTLDLSSRPHKQGPCVHSVGQSADHQFSGREEVCTGGTAFKDELTSTEKNEEAIKTSAVLFENNPFIPANIEREHSFLRTSKSHSPDAGAAQDYQTANVKNRAHLFESMPFDKIRHQNKDEIEAMVENIKETLNSLYHVKAICSGGSIIEVNETMIAKKAKFTLSEGGPQIKYDEVAEGGAQNFILQLLPRTNLKPQIIYLKEDSKGSIQAKVLNVPVHQHQFTTNQDTEFKTANVAQVVEDVLNQDNSLRKGVIIQEDVDRVVEVIVYSLYAYFDEGDVKSYCPPQSKEYDEPEPERGNVNKLDDGVRRKGAVESIRSCFPETSKDHTCQQSVRAEITVKGNVKLFKNCIEKGDLEYLKSLEREPTVQDQELPPSTNVAGQCMELHREQRGDQAEESSSEWVSVDVKRLKNMFSGDQRPTQPKQYVCEALGRSQSSTECHVGIFSHGQPGNTFQECEANTQKGARNATSAPHGPYRQVEAQDGDSVHLAELVEVVDDNDEISNLQTAIQQVAVKAESLHHPSRERQKFMVQESSKDAAGDVKHDEEHREDPCKTQGWDDLPLASNITSELKSDCQRKSTETCPQDTTPAEIQTTETCSKMGQRATGVVQKSDLVSGNSSVTADAQQEDEEVVFQGKLQAAFNSLERSNINVARGDFRAAMIYRNSSKPHKERAHYLDAVSVQKPAKEDFCSVSELKSTHTPLRQQLSKEQVTAANADPLSQSETLNKAASSAVLEKSRRPVGPKPAIPPKPDHLKVKQRDNQSTYAKTPEVTQTNTVRFEETFPKALPTTSVSHVDEHKQDPIKINSSKHLASDAVDLRRNDLLDEALLTSEGQVRHQVQGCIVTLENDKTEKNSVNQQQEINVTAEEKRPNEFKDDMNETDESHVDFQEACKKFGGKTFSVKNAPVKPKRLKIAQPDNKNRKHMSGDNRSSILTHVVEESQQTSTGPSCNNLNACGQTADSTDKHQKEMKPESRVEMREKKRRTETEDERRQRLSVHMDEIMRGNITAAMEIFDNMRKQEELQSILSRVEEIEQDTSGVDVRSLRGVFENVPDWAVSSDQEKHKKAKVENKGERTPSTRDNTESKSSMAHVFGDLERASEEIMNLKEQTLARLMDIEGAIKKALYSVSTLKSDSDIAGLSCLFKESLGGVQGSPSSGNISKISIGSSRTKSHQTQENTALPTSQSACTEVASAKQRASPPSSPAFISIQSAARKTDTTEVLSPETAICPTCQHSPMTEEKYRTTKTLTCNSPAQNRKRDPRKGGQKQSIHNPKREVSVLEVQTDCEGNSITGTKTVTENYERTDNFGNRFYSSKTSTVVTAQPDTRPSSRQASAGPATCQVTKYPEVRLPINQKP